MIGKENMIDKIVPIVIDINNLIQSLEGRLGFTRYENPKLHRVHRRRTLRDGTQEFVAINQTRPYWLFGRKDALVFCGPYVDEKILFDDVENLILISHSNYYKSYPFKPKDKQVLEAVRALSKHSQDYRFGEDALAYLGINND